MDGRWFAHEHSLRAVGTLYDGAPRHAAAALLGCVLPCAGWAPVSLPLAVAYSRHHAWVIRVSFACVRVRPPPSVAVPS